MVRTKKFIGKVFVNRRTGQATIILPKKELTKFFKKVPSQVEVKMKW